MLIGIWGGKGQGKSFQTELIFQAMGVEPVIMSAGELESERAGKSTCALVWPVTTTVTGVSLVKFWTQVFGLMYCIGFF